MDNIPYDDFEMFMDWQKTKSELKFNPPVKNFKIFYNCIYWAFMGCNIGSEEGKHRPVLVTRTYKNSPICTVIPLTTQRLNDSKQYHVDLEHQDSTALCEQMRIIDIARIDKPMYRNNKILTITEKDWEQINHQIERQYLLSELIEQKKQKNPNIVKNDENEKSVSN